MIEIIFTLIVVGVAVAMVDSGFRQRLKKVSRDSHYANTEQGWVLFYLHTVTGRLYEFHNTDFGPGGDVLYFILSGEDGNKFPVTEAAFNKYYKFIGSL